MRATWYPIFEGYLCTSQPVDVEFKGDVLYLITDDSEYVLNLSDEALAEAKRRNEQVWPPERE